LCLGKLAATLLVIILLIPMLGAIGAAEDTDTWSGYGGSPAHTHLSGSSTEGNRGGLVWKLRFMSDIGGQPVITDRGTIIINDRSGNVTEISANGEIIRRVSLGEECIRTPALGADGTIVIASNDTLHLLDQDLTEIWSRNFTRILSTPTIAEDGTIYVSTEVMGLVSSSGLYALSSDCAIKWSIRNQWVDSGKTPAVGPDGTIYDGGMELPVRAVSPEGQVLWQYRGFDPENRSSAESAPICVGPDGTVYVGTFDGIMFAFHSNGTVKWKYEVGEAIGASPSLGPDGTLFFSTQDLFSYGISDSQRLYAIDPEGHCKWTFRLTSAIGSAAAISSDGRIYLYDLSRGLIALDPEGHVLWVAGGWPDVGGWDVESPVIGKDGTVYALMDGGLMAFKIGAPGQPQDASVYRHGSEAWLSWDLPYTDGGDAITGYAVYRYAWRSDPLFWEEEVLVAVLDDPGDRSFQDQGLIEGVSYAYLVCAINGYGEGLRAEVVPLEDELSWQFPMAVIFVFIASVILVRYGIGPRNDQE
jgi:outer membrane protein assembly factor BamB